MFGSKKNKSKSKKRTNGKKAAASKSAEGKCMGTSSGHRSSEDIRAEAMVNVRAARDNLGQETIDKIAALMTQMENSPIKKATAQIHAADTDRVLDELKWMLDSRD